MKKYPAIPLIIAGLLLIVAGIVFGLSLKKSSGIPSEDNHLPLKSVNNDVGEVVESGKNGLKKYNNHQAKFSIEFDGHLKVIEESHTDSEDSSVTTGRVIFCESDVDKTLGTCNDGFHIEYGVPEGNGWGGGCDPKDKSSLTVLEADQSVCMNDTYFSQLYLSHPEQISKVNIYAYFTKDFSKDEALTMLKSFEFEK